MGQPNPADGATPPAEPTKNEPAKTEQPATDGLGEAGKKALEQERAARKELERQLRELQQRDPMKQLAELKQQFEQAQLRALRLEVAAAKGLTPKQAARLQGSTREELEADADDLLATFGTASGAQQSQQSSGTPAPDPTQGARGGMDDLKARIAAAEAKGTREGAREAIRLKEELAARMAAAKQ
jgi:hypothetical protein